MAWFVNLILSAALILRSLLRREAENCRGSGCNEAKVRDRYDRIKPVYVSKLIELQRNPSIGRRCRSTTTQVSPICFHKYLAKVRVDTIRQSLTLDSILLRVSAGVYNVKFSIEGRVACDGMYFPEGELPLQLRIEVIHILFLQRLSLEIFLNSAPEKGV